MFKIEITKNGRKTLVKDAITTRAMTFDSRDHAEKFAAGMLANWAADYRSQGRKASSFTVVEG